MSMFKLRKTAIILASAAAFTVATAQFPWETGGDDYSSSSSGSESSSSEGSSTESEYSFGGGEESGSLDGVTEDAFASGGESADDAASKPKKERAPRAAVPGFSSQKSCPVCNSVKLKKNLYVSNGGQRIHVCSASCIGRVKRNPDAFVKILQKRGESPES